MTNEPTKDTGADQLDNRPATEPANTNIVVRGDYASVQAIQLPKQPPKTS